MVIWSIRERILVTCIFMCNMLVQAYMNQILLIRNIKRYTNIFSNKNQYPHIAWTLLFLKNLPFLNLWIKKQKVLFNAKNVLWRLKRGVETSFWSIPSRLGHMGAVEGCVPELGLWVSMHSTGNFISISVLFWTLVSRYQAERITRLTQSKNFVFNSSQSVF